MKAPLQLRTPADWWEQCGTPPPDGVFGEVNARPLLVHAPMSQAIRDVVEASDGYGKCIGDQVSARWKSQKGLSKWCENCGRRIEPPMSHLRRRCNGCRRR